MSVSPEPSESAPKAGASDSPAPSSPRLATEAKNTDARDDQAETTNDRADPTEDSKEPSSKLEADESDNIEATSAPPLPEEIPPPLPDETAPPLPDETAPPLPEETAPAQTEDDGWDPIWDGHAQAYYFYNRFTGVSQWENPRVPQAPVALASTASVPPAPGTYDPPQPAQQPEPVIGGYNPAIHGDYDPNADYARYYEEPAATAGVDPAAAYAATGTFNRFTGRWQAASINPENHNDENKSRRQMNAFFDVDAAANSHGGRSLRAERSARKLTKQELKAFKEKRREKKEEKRRAWLRD
ncbi:uncharacterized protein N7515_000404 [Penicillium bovifimosum]|uniref:WW domain-containing protein n=1 Tax=Penicillium bovifimosum TaxID=126998 RepID=A0A9W9LBE7_9EURO|nr:uncharacterized protein N7515_000404 [Penicillium bovifimosum]KAJ5145840.1 hypothetical protein N7515_000404 [Penicillium bovifimosum]